MPGTRRLIWRDDGAGVRGPAVWIGIRRRPFATPTGWRLERSRCHSLHEGRQDRTASDWGTRRYRRRKWSSRMWDARRRGLLQWRGNAREAAPSGQADETRRVARQAELGLRSEKLAAWRSLPRAVARGWGRTRQKEWTILKPRPYGLRMVSGGGRSSGEWDG